MSTRRKSITLLCGGVPVLPTILLGEDETYKYVVTETKSIVNGVGDGEIIGRTSVKVHSKKQRESTDVFKVEVAIRLNLSLALKSKFSSEVPIAVLHGSHEKKEFSHEIAIDKLQAQQSDKNLGDRIPVDFNFELVKNGDTWVLPDKLKNLNILGNFLGPEGVNIYEGVRKVLISEGIRKCKIVGNLGSLILRHEDKAKDKIYPLIQRSFMRKGRLLNELPYYSNFIESHDEVSVSDLTNIKQFQLFALAIKGDQVDFSFLGGIAGITIKKLLDYALPLFELGRNNLLKGKGEGFKADCFITTIVCENLGFEDTCFELETLRAFRDRNKEVIDVRSYEEISKIIISSNVLNAAGGVKLNKWFYNSVVLPCISLIAKSNDREACRLYESGVIDLLEKINTFKPYKYRS